MRMYFQNPFAFILRLLHRKTFQPRCGELWQRGEEPESWHYSVFIIFLHVNSSTRVGQFYQQCQDRAKDNEVFTKEVTITLCMCPFS